MSEITYAVEVILPKSEQDSTISDRRQSVISAIGNYGDAALIAMNTSKLPGIEGSIIFDYSASYVDRKMSRMYVNGAIMSRTIMGYAADSLHIEIVPEQL